MFYRSYHPKRYSKKKKKKKKKKKIRQTPWVEPFFYLTGTARINRSFYLNFSPQFTLKQSTVKI
jgi:hypothetical protein